MKRVVLWFLLAFVVTAVVIAVVIAVPILTHKSAGGSGQDLGSASGNSVSASGDDGRTRVLEALTLSGDPLDVDNLEPGQEIIVRGTGYDSKIGIYVSFCAVPPGDNMRPSPCLGGVPANAQEAGANTGKLLPSAWVTDDFGWSAFATHNYLDSETGAFEVHLLVPEPTESALDCMQQACALVTRADHTASMDRVQDMLVPIEFKN